MSKKSMSKQVMCLVIIGSMVIPNGVYAEEIINKDESVFVNLSQKGNIKDEVVSEWLHSENSLSNINDKSDLKGIKNIKGTEKPTTSDGKLIWNSDKKDLFYQGTTDKELPLKVDIKYYLDGEEMDPKDMAGKSGDIKIKIHFTNTQSKIVQIKGKDKKIYTPFSTLTLATLPNDVFTDIKINRGQLTSEGNNSLVNFISFPGLKESLDIDDKDLDLDLPEDLEIDAKTNKFKLGPIFVTATPQLPDIKEFKDASDIDELKDGIEKLKDSAQKLCEGTLKLSDGSKQLNDALHQLKNGTNMAKDGVKKAKAEMAKSSDKIDLIRVPSNVQAERKLIDDSFMAMNMDTSLLKDMAPIMTPESLGLVNKIGTDLKKADINSIKNNPMLKQLPELMKPQNIKNLEKLTKDADTIDTIDMKRVQSIMKLTSVKPKLENLMKKTKPLVSGLKSDMENLQPIIEGLTIAAPKIQKLMQDAKPLVGFDMNKLKPMTDLLQSSDKINNMLGNVEALGKKDLSTIKTVMKKQITESTNFVSSANKAGLKNAQSKGDLEGKIKNSNLDEETKGKMKAITDLAFGTKTKMIKSAPTMGQIASEFNKLEKMQNSMKANGPFLHQMQQALDPKNTKKISDAIKSLNKIKNNVSNPENKEAIVSVSKALSEKNRNKIKGMLGKVKLMQSTLDNTKTKDIMYKVEKALSKENVDYIEDIMPKLTGMKQDLDANKNNIKALKGMIKTIKEPGTKAMLSKLNSIKQDVNKAEPIMQSLNNPVTLAKIKNIPKMTGDLTSMQKDLVNNKKILEVMKDALSEGNVTMANNLLKAVPSLTDGVNKLSDGVGKIVDGSDELTSGSGELNDGMNKFNDEGIKEIDKKATPKIDGLEEIIDTKDAIVNMSKEYDTFTGKGEEMTGKVKFIMKTDEVKIPKVEHKAKHETKKKKMGFFEWILNLF